MKVIILALASVLCASAQATTYGLHIASVHVPSASYQNNFNPGVYLRTDGGFTAGVYYNTLRRTSVYAGGTFEYGPFGVMAGVVTGYEPKLIEGRIYGQGKKLSPMLALSLRLPVVAGVTPKLMFVPGYKKGPATLHLAIEKSF